MHGLVGNTRASSLEATPAPVAASVDSGLDVLGFIGVLRRHVRLVFLTALAVFGLAVLVTFQLEARYTANAYVVVDTRDSQILGFEAGFTETTNASSSIVDTEVEIARSNKVVERAATALDIGSWSEFAPSPPLSDSLKSLVGIGTEPVAASSPSVAFKDLPVVEQTRLVDAFSKKIKVRRVGLTSVIAISATAADPSAAAEMANAMADAYLTEQISAKLDSNDRAAAFLRNRVDSLANDVGTLETQIDTFITEKLAELGSPETRALLARINSEEQQRRGQSRAIEELNEALAQDDLDRLTQLVATQEQDISNRRAALVAEVSAAGDSGALRAARERLDALDAEIRGAARAQSSALQTELALSHARTSSARTEISNALDRIELPQDLSVALFRLQREAETSRNLYQTYLTKLRTLEQQADFDVPDSRLIAAATSPTEPSFPPRRLILAGSLIFAFGAGIGLAVLREYFVGGVVNVEQLEAMSGIVVAGSIPRYPADDPSDRADRAIVAHPLSAFSEGVRRVLLGIEAYAPSARSIFVTSALPGDGKTTMALALARHAALTGKSVLLIDADLRHPSVHKLLDDSVDGGLIDYLVKNGEGDVAGRIKIVKEPETGAHFLFGAGASSIATDGLLMSQRFANLMAYARANYELVIVDTPPVGLVVDATIVARHADAGLFVVRYAATPQQAVRNGVRELVRRVEVPVYGVLNDVDLADGTYYGYSKRYRAYYNR